MDLKVSEINKLNKYLAVSKQKNTQLKFDKDLYLYLRGVWNYQSLQFQGRSLQCIFHGCIQLLIREILCTLQKSPLKANPCGIIKQIMEFQG